MWVIHDLWKRLLRDETKCKENVWLICINLFASEQFQSIKLSLIFYFIFFLPWTLFKIYNLVHFQPWEFRLSAICMLGKFFMTIFRDEQSPLSLFFESASVFHQIFNVDDVFHGKSQTSRLKNFLKYLSIAMELTFDPAIFFAYFWIKSSSFPSTQ